MILPVFVIVLLLLVTMQLLCHALQSSVLVFFAFWKREWAHFENSTQLNYTSHTLIRARAHILLISHQPSRLYHTPKLFSFVTVPGYLHERWCRYRFVVELWRHCPCNRRRGWFRKGLEPQWKPSFSDRTSFPSCLQCRLGPRQWHDFIWKWHWSHGQE